jgi:hypothetical protein
MSLQEEDKTATYGSDAPSLREAAKEIAPPEPEVATVEVSDDAPAELTTRQAGKELSKYQEKVAEEQAAIRTAMGEGVPEPTEIEQLRSKVEKLEQSRQSVDVDAAYERGQAELQQAHQAQHQVAQFRAELSRRLSEAHPDVQTLEDLQSIASFNPEYAAAVVRDLQDCQAAIAQAEQAAVGQATLAHQALAVWGSEQDRQFAERHKELTSNPAAHQKAAEAAREVLREAGMSDEQIVAGWNSGQLRTAQAQEILLMAARHKLGQKALTKARAKPKVPPVSHRPGVASGRKEAYGIQAAEKRLNQTHSLKDAARLLSLRQKG